MFFTLKVAIIIIPFSCLWADWVGLGIWFESIKTQGHCITHVRIFLLDCDDEVFYFSISQSHSHLAVCASLSQHWWALTGRSAGWFTPKGDDNTLCLPCLFELLALSQMDVSHLSNVLAPACDAVAGGYTAHLLTLCLLNELLKTGNRQNYENSFLSIFMQNCSLDRFWTTWLDRLTHSF